MPRDDGKEGPLHFLALLSLVFKGLFTQVIFVAQLNAIFVALKLQLQNCTFKLAAISGQKSPV